MTRGYFRLVAWSILPLLLYVALRRYLQAVNVVRPVMLALVTDAHPKPYLWRLLVDRRHQRRGIGRRPGLPFCGLRA